MLDSQRNPFVLRMSATEKHTGIIKFEYFLNLENPPNLPNY